MKPIKTAFNIVIALELAGAVGVILYYKKLEKDVEYRRKLHNNSSYILEGTCKDFLESFIAHYFVK